MRYIEELVDLLSRVICQYLNSSSHGIDGISDGNNEISSCTKKEYLTREENFFAENRE